MQLLIFGAFFSLYNYTSVTETQELKTFDNRAENVTSYSGISLECYLSSILWSVRPTHRRCRGFCCTWSHSMTHTHTHTRCASSRRMVSPSQRPLPDNTQHSQQTDIHVPGGIRTRNPSKRAAVNLRLRPREHQCRQNVITKLTVSGRWFWSETPDLYSRGALFDSQWEPYTDWGFCGYFNPSR